MGKPKGQTDKTEANLVSPHLVGESCLSKSNFDEKFDGQGFVRRSTTPCKPGTGVKADKDFYGQSFLRRSGYSL